MRKGLTEIVLLLDKSGSMSDLTKDTIGSVNKFLADQKKVPGDANVTICAFNTELSSIRENVPLWKCGDLMACEYEPDGCTALFDAFAKTIDSVGARLATMDEHDRPEHVVFVVVTDGEENSSRVFTCADVKQRVTHQTDVYKWTFIFLGANIDAFVTGANLGTTSANNANYSATPQGTHALYAAVSKAVQTVRNTGILNTPMAALISDAEKA